ncbi:hypothetical protein NC652_011700 [Populus alba x Populus x berolinensis]|nr:hypothetical protein NC652_011700 [Populus alba x Populus x berolinensis]
MITSFPKFYKKRGRSFVSQISLPTAILLLFSSLKILKIREMINLVDPSMSLLAASGGDTVKLFDVSVEPGDPCTLNYTPTPGCVVNSVKWNHTNLVVASAGEDKKISLWRKNGQNTGTIPVSGTDNGDSIEVILIEVY